MAGRSIQDGTVVDFGPDEGPVEHSHDYRITHPMEDDIEIELVDEYTFLGQMIAFEQRLNKEFQARRKKAWKIYWALRQIFKSKMQLASKIRILDSCIIPSLMYGAQTWSLTKSQAKSFHVTQ